MFENILRTFMAEILKKNLKKPFTEPSAVLSPTDAIHAFFL